MDNKRLAVKWVRDKAKSHYNKDSNCRACDTTEELQFHHFNSVTQLWNIWLKKYKIVANSDEEVKAVRDRFIEEHQYELYEATVTLCKSCHDRLHKVYGLKPKLFTASKQKRWVEKQRTKNGLV